MRLYLDGQIFERQTHGGVSRVWTNYVREFVSQGVQLTAILPSRSRNPGIREISSTPSVEVIWSRQLTRPPTVFDSRHVRNRHLARLLEDRDPAIIQSTWHSSLSFEKWAEVMMVHDLIPELFYKPRKTLWHARVLANRRLAISNASRLVAVSTNTAQDLVAIYPEAARKTSIVPNGPTLGGSVQASDFEDLAARLQLNARRGDFYLHIGNRRGYKNFKIIEDLISSSPKDARRGLVSVGGEVPNRTPKHPSITIIPYVSDHDLAALYENARALILPSLYEGFGLPVLEAMDRGCPVVSSFAASLPEIGGDAATYFNPKSVKDLRSALRRIEQIGREAILRAGHENVARFSWERSAAAMIDVYRELDP